MSNSDSDGPIGFSAPPLKGVETKIAKTVGVSRPPPVPARNTTMEKVRVTKSILKKPVPVPVKAEAPVPVPVPVEADAPVPVPVPAPVPVPVEAEVPSLVISEIQEQEQEQEANDYDVSAAAEDVKVVLKGRKKKAQIPLPAEAPMLTADDLTEQLKKRIVGKNPVKAVGQTYDLNDKLIAAEEYRPITSADFPDFMIQSYAQYSPHLQRLLKEGTSMKPMEIDKDACKKRDPNKVETFYYQNFVRDFLSRGTPYRGLLVYHGLGTGKTCTSIAAAEALYWGGQKKIFVLTPATLSNNYRKDLGKCGYFPLRQNNFWGFLKLPSGQAVESTPIYIWLTTAMGLPPDIVMAQGGGWIPNPDRPSNWETLSSPVKEAIRAQQTAHLNFRFKFIHYNGVVPSVLAQLAAAGVQEGQSMFDDAVIVIDEIHNLVRTINGTQIFGKPIAQFIERSEPREHTWTTPITKERPGFRYPRGYTLYRLLQNAVGAKIIALSATPMINYAQELAILVNLIGGEQRTVEIPLKGVASTDAIAAWARAREDVDFYSVEEAADRSTILVVTPVPFGFRKVVRNLHVAAKQGDIRKAEVEDYTSRGFVRIPASRLGPVKESHERRMDLWAESLVKDLVDRRLLAVPSYRLRTFPMLPEDGKEFVANFVDRATLAIKHENVLKARLTGLISYYRGGSEELMPRMTRNDVVEVPMSDFMFKEYSVARLAELEMDKPAKKEEEEGQKKRKGMTEAEVDLYTLATKSQQTGFLALSRAACNWVFPTDVPRPNVSVKDRVKLLGAEQSKLIDADYEEDADADVSAAPPEADGPPEATGDALIPDAVPPPEPSALDATLAGILGSLMSGLEKGGDRYLGADLAVYSPKYAAIIERIRTSPGPVLVYSQFKTLEGLGIFAAALRFSEKYLPLDIQKVSGEWIIPEALMSADKGRPRYILYTGDQDLEKRRLLLQLYNADISSLPPRLSAQCAELLGDAPDNRDGRVCRVFMITQSGAEGISLFNTRQVHIMEPYWNNVRLQQVIGRAIRLCSHMNLAWEERTVDVFTYLSVFTEAQKGQSKEIMKSDKYMTTDQVIFDIATKKQQLADNLFKIAQSAAADCQVHLEENQRDGQAIQCFKFAKGGRPMFMYHPDWKKDLQAQFRSKR